MPIEFYKGHATLNDFVVLVDPEDQHPLTPKQVQVLCDRRGGIGGDGLLRVVRARHIPDWRGDPQLWFMDYRNADGSTAEMCGNGLRLFVHFLITQSLATGPLVQVATRAGLRTGELIGDGQVRVCMGPARLTAEKTTITHLGTEYLACGIDVGNPHAVIFVTDAQELAALDLGTAPEYDPVAFPAGVNTEFAYQRGSRDLEMRVYERGVGETFSCGTGVVATAAAQAHRLGEQGEFTVRVRGGQLRVDIDEQCYLTGPAAIVAQGTTTL